MFVKAVFGIRRLFVYEVTILVAFEVVPVEGLLNVSNLCSTGIPRKESIN